MNLNRIAVTCVAPVLLGFTAFSAPALAAPTHLEQAMLGELDAPTRAEVQKRVTGGNTVSGVLATILLNNYYKAGAKNPSEAITAVAIDFARGAVVFRHAQDNSLVLQNFDPKTLQMRQ